MRDGSERSSYAPLESSEQKGIGFVYFLGSPDGTRIKIGFSGKPSWDRLQTHSEGDAFGMGGDYTILAVVRGTRHAETELKSYFKAHGASDRKKEVFHSGPLLPYVTWLR